MGGSTAPGEYSMAMFELSASMQWTIHPYEKELLSITEEDSKAIFELSQSMQWTRLEKKFQIGHFAPLAIPIPDELVSKQE